MSQLASLSFWAREVAVLTGSIAMDMTLGLPTWVWWAICYAAIYVAWRYMPRSEDPFDYPGNRYRNREEKPEEVSADDIDPGDWSEESRLALELQKRKEQFWERRWKKITNSEFVLIFVFAFILLVMVYTFPRMFESTAVDEFPNDLSLHDMQIPQSLNFPG